MRAFCTNFNSLEPVSKQHVQTDTNLSAKNLITEKNITYALKKPENKILKPQNKTDHLHKKKKIPNFFKTKKTRYYYARTMG